MDKNIISSRLNHRIIFLENTSNPEIEEPAWREKVKTFAEIKAICDNKFLEMEGVKFGHMITEGYFHFIVRYLRDINTNMRILFAERSFDIKRIIDVREERKILKIIALEIT
jgi:head-tail adaptor